MSTIKIGKRPLIGLSLLTVMLAACAPSVDGWQVLAAQHFCEPHGGIDRIHNVFGVTMRCRDGTIYVPKAGG